MLPLVVPALIHVLAHRKRSIEGYRLRLIALPVEEWGYPDPKKAGTENSPARYSLVFFFLLNV